MKKKRVFSINVWNVRTWARMSRVCAIFIPNLSLIRFTFDFFFFWKSLTHAFHVVAFSFCIFMAKKEIKNLKKMKIKEGNRNRVVSLKSGFFIFCMFTAGCDTAKK